MKTLLKLTVLLLLSGCASYSLIPINYGDYPTTKEISVEFDKNELFVIANSWMVEIFNDAEHIIQYSDKEAGVIKGRYMISGALTSSSYGYGTTTNDTRVYAIITVQVKNDLTKITIDPQGSGEYILPQPNSIFYTDGYGSGGELLETLGLSLIADYENFITTYQKW